MEAECHRTGDDNTSVTLCIYSNYRSVVIGYFQRSLATIFFQTCLGCLDSWVMSHLALNISTLRHALGCEFKPWWQCCIHAAHHLCFLHDSSCFIWFDTIICLSNLSCELWNRKLKINEFFLKKRAQKFECCDYLCGQLCKISLRQNMAILEVI